MKKLASFLAAFLMSSMLANAQFSIDQITQFGNSADQVPAGMSISNGALYIAGNDAGQSMVLKYGTENISTLVWNIQWPKTSSPVLEWFSGVAADANGVYVSGCSYSQTTDGSGDKEQKAIMCKFPLNGATGTGLGGADWISKPTFFPYNGGEIFYGNMVHSENDTNYIYSFGAAQENWSNSTAILAKHNTQGNLIWKETIGSTAAVQDVTNAICVLNNYIYIGGHENHFTLWKSDLAGNKIWSKSTETEVVSWMKGLCASNQHLFAAGYEEIAGRGKEALIIKYDEGGNVLWKKVWGGTLEDIANGIEFIDNTLWVVGETSSYGSGGKDAFVLKLNAADGSIIDSVFGGGTQDDAALKILKDGQSVYISGTFQGTAKFGPMTLTSSGGKDLFLMKMISSIPSAQGIPVIADANTVILDHFDGTNIGETVGTPPYVQSTNGLSQAIELAKPGNYIIYSKSVNMEAAGTIEMWLYPKSYSRRLLNINWNYIKSSPPSGHVFHMSLDSLGKVSFSTWGYSISNSFKGNARIPLNTWTHIAVTWSDSTKIYINGKLDMVSALLCRPAIRNQAYFYLPYWGDSTGYFDEFHVSKVKRTGAEIAARIYTENPNKAYSVTAGNLSGILNSYEKSILTTLKLSGSIDARDFKTMRDSMPMIETIDLSQVTIVSYTGTEGTRNTAVNFYPENAIPRNAFYLATEKSKLTTIIQPSNLLEIGRSAYFSCSGLKNINWPSGLTSIGNAAFYNCRSLQDIVLPSGVTVIDTNAFRACIKLTSVMIPSTINDIRYCAFYQCNELATLNFQAGSQLTYIGNYAFSECIKLTSVTIPSSVKEIQYGAFMRCSELTTLNFLAGSQLTHIGRFAFGFCPKLTSFTLQPTVNFIGNVAFLGTGIELNIPANHPYFATINGVLYDKALSKLMYCPVLKTGRIDLPQTVTTIAEDAFYNCRSVDSISIPSSLQVIEDWAFENCTGLKTLTIPASVNQIGSYAYYNCSGLKALYVYSVAPIDLSRSDSVFNFVNRTTCTLYVLSGLKAQYQVADKWKEFANIVEISDALTVTPGTLNTVLSKEKRAGLKRLNLTGSIDARDFKTMRDSMPLLEYIDLSNVNIVAYSGRGGTVDTTDYSYIADMTPFRAMHNPNNNTVLQTVILPNTLKIIGRSSFNRCINLSKVVIPPTVTTIERLAFYVCSNLKSVTIPSSVTSILYGAFMYTGLTSVEVPEGVRTLGEYVFQSCHQLEYISLPSTLEYIGYCGITYNDNLKWIEVASSNPVFSSLDGVLFDKLLKTLVSYPNKKSSYYRVPDGVTTIDTAAFEGCWALGQLDLPSTLTKICLEAFYDCNGIEYIELPASVNSIEAYAFRNCGNLKTLNARPLTPVNITASTSIFDGIDKNLCILRVPSGSKFAYQGANVWNTFPTLAEDVSKQVSITAGGLFNALTSVERNTVTHLKISGTMDARDFKTMRENMPLIAEVDLRSVSIVAYTGTDGCAMYTTQYQANAIPPDAFFFRDYVTKKSWLTKVLFPASLTTIGDASFTQSGLRSVVLHEGITRVDGWAFNGCRLNTITLPASLTTVGENAFGGNIGLNSFTVASGNPAFTTIDGLLYDKSGKTLFYYPNAKSTEGIIPEGTQTIQSHAFENCDFLTSLYIPASVNSIVAPAFTWTGNLKYFKVAASNTSFSAMDGVLFDKMQKKIVAYPNQKGGYYDIPFGINEIGAAAFRGCWNLNALNIPMSVTKIGNTAFNFCSNLTRIVIPTSINTIESEAFSQCFNLKAITVNWYNPVDLTNSPNVFSGVDKATCVLKVPQGTASNYWAANQWNEFSFIDEVQNMTYRVMVPAGTKACYIAGEMNGWTQQPMTKEYGNVYTINTFAHMSDQYKYCSGPDWIYEELDTAGNVINDRNYNWMDTVRTWRNVYQPWMPYSPWKIESNPSYSIGKIQFVSATEGWIASGNDNSLLHSTDGGETWNKVTPFPGDLAGNFSDPAVTMDWISPTHGWAMKTLSADPTSIFGSPDGAILYSTANGGNTWSRKAFPKTRPTITYSDADFQGTWQIHEIIEADYQSLQGLFSGWSHVKMNIGANGSITFSDNVLSSGTWEQTVQQYELLPDGTFTMAGTDLNGFLNADKNTGFLTMTNEIGCHVFGVMQKQIPGTVYATSDLQGTWQMHNLIVGNPATQSMGKSGWVYASATIDASGNAQLNMISSSGDINSVSVQFTITSEGFVSMPDMNWHGYMSADKTAFYSTFTDDGGKAFDLCIMQKQVSGNSYATADLEGIWRVHEIVLADANSFLSGSRLGVASLNIRKDGNGTVTNSDKGDDSNKDNDVKLSITTAGIVTLDSMVAHGYMNAQKNAIVFTMSEDNNPSMLVLQKDSTYSGDMGLQVQFTDENNGWASTYNWVTTGYRFYRSFNGGNDWNLVSYRDPVGFFDFVDTNNGWAVTMPSDSAMTPAWTIIHTTDGGLNWTPQYQVPANDDRSFNALQFTDLNHGWVTGGNGMLLKTVDGGQHWAAVTNSGHTTGIDNTTGTDSKALFFLDANTGWITVEHHDDNGLEILHTTDGGASWTSQNTNLTEGSIFSLCFWDENHGWFTGETLDENSENRNYTGIIGRLDNGVLKVGKPVSKNELLIYPNPVKDGFYIRSLEPGSMVSIYNLNGATVLKQRAEGDCYMDVKDLKKGMYIVRITTSSGVVNKKIVKM